MGREGGVEDWLVNSLSVSRLESKREEGRREGGAFRSKLMRGLALTARTLPPIPPNGLLGWTEMPPAAFPGYSKRSGENTSKPREPSPDYGSTFVRY